jgi:TRAP-type C4-dicarboxylate transport system permease small subunit
MSSYEWGLYNYDINALYKYPEISFSQTSLHLDLPYGILYFIVTFTIIGIMIYYIYISLSVFHD